MSALQVMVTGQQEGPDWVVSVACEAVQFTSAEAETYAAAFKNLASVKGVVVVEHKILKIIALEGADRQKLFAAVTKLAGQYFTLTASG